MATRKVIVEERLVESVLGHCGLAVVASVGQGYSAGFYNGLRRVVFDRGLTVRNVRKSSLRKWLPGPTLWRGNACLVYGETLPHNLGLLENLFKMRAFLPGDRPAVECFSGYQDGDTLGQRVAGVLASVGSRTVAKLVVCLGAIRGSKE